MCGIVGLVAKKAMASHELERRIRALGDRIEHRGPDDAGWHVGEGFAFLNRRLSIVDISGGKQPIYARGGALGIVFNGEIYNHLELRRELVELGHKFQTSSDTEVILKMFDQYGPASFARLEGMFGVCVWDDQEKVAYLSRDVFGMKPLYVYEDEQQLAFCSELSPLLSIPGADIGLSDDGLADYLTFRFTAAPRTVFKRIRRVEPGCYLRIGLNDGHSSHWNFLDLADMEPAAAPISYDEAKEELRSLMLESVRTHLMGEARVAMFLSGGVDSSVIAGLLNVMGVRLRAYNVGFPSVNEFKFSTEVAERSGIDLVNFEVSPSEIFARIDEIIRALDEPLADPACFPLYLLCEQITGYAKVVLSGEGADELFGGYPQYGLHGELESDERLMRRFLERSWYFLDGGGLLKAGTERTDWHRFRKYFVGPSNLDAMALLDFRTWVPEDLMMKADKICMRHSLEGRFPFLNSKIWRFARSLPPSFRIGPDGTTKRIIKDAFADMLPHSVIHRPKMGFTVPTDEILLVMREAVMDQLADLRNSTLGEHLDLDRITKIFLAFYAGDRSVTLRAWTIFILLRWHHNVVSQRALAFV